MDTWETILTIAKILALLGVAALCVYLIMVLLRVKQILADLDKSFKELTTRVFPILENAEYITSRLKSVAESIDDQVLTIRESISSVRKIADNVVDLERRVQERIEGPILDSISFAAAVVKGLRTFVDRVRT